MAKAQGRQRVQANKHHREIDFEVGDRVYVSTKHWNTGRRSRKLADQMAGPFPTIAREGNAYRLQLPSGINVHPVINPEYLRKDPNNPLSGQTEDPQPPIEINGENEWEVEKIPASRKRGRKLQYRARSRPRSEVVQCFELQGRTKFSCKNHFRGYINAYIFAVNLNLYDTVFNNNTTCQCPSAE